MGQGPFGGVGVGDGGSAVFRVGMLRYGGWSIFYGAVEERGGGGVEGNGG